MTVRLTIEQAAWRAHVAAAAQAYGPTLVPVIKGNGYGFGRTVLRQVVSELPDSTEYVCVGNIYELAKDGAGAKQVVLTPIVEAPSLPLTTDAILTVGSAAHVDTLRGWSGEVMVKVASSMRRFGATVEELPGLLRAVENLGLGLAGFAIHLPLTGDDEARVAEIETWLPELQFDVPLWISHLAPETVHTLQVKYPLRKFKARVGTALWHGVPKVPHLQLQADVLSVQPIGVGEIAGYHHTRAPFDGTLVVIGAGSAHGVAANDTPSRQSLSPFHFARTRMTLLELPHMHTSMVIVEADATAPKVGEWVDVQRPLITTQVDHLEWM